MVHEKEHGAIPASTAKRKSVEDPKTTPGTTRTLAHGTVPEQPASPTFSRGGVQLASERANSRHHNGPNGRPFIDARPNRDEEDVFYHHPDTYLDHQYPPGPAPQFHQDDWYHASYQARVSRSESETQAMHIVSQTDGLIELLANAVQTGQLPQDFGEKMGPLGAKLVDLLEKTGILKGRKEENSSLMGKVDALCESITKAREADDARFKKLEEEIREARSPSKTLADSIHAPGQNPQLNPSSYASRTRAGAPSGTRTAKPTPTTPVHPAPTTPEEPNRVIVQFKEEIPKKERIDSYTVVQEVNKMLAITPSGPDTHLKTRIRTAGWNTKGNLVLTVGTSQSANDVVDLFHSHDVYKHLTALGAQPSQVRTNEKWIRLIVDGVATGVRWC